MSGQGWGWRWGAAWIGLVAGEWNAIQILRNFLRVIGVIISRMAMLQLSFFRPTVSKYFA